MPLHDWTRVPAFAFHDFHVGWLLRVGTALNTAVLPAAEYAALLAPVTPHRQYSLVRPRNRLTVRRTSDERVVAVLEVVSPDDKATARRAGSIVSRLARAVRAGCHVLLVDPFPPTHHDPAGVHGDVWIQLDGGRYTPPDDQPLTLAAYEASDPARCYVEPLAAGDRLPDMPLFLEPGVYVNVPLEFTYQAAFAHLLPQDRAALEA